MGLGRAFLSAYPRQAPRCAAAPLVICVLDWSFAYMVWPTLVIHRTRILAGMPPLFPFSAIPFPLEPTFLVVFASGPVGMA